MSKEPTNSDASCWNDDLKQKLLEAVRKPHEDAKLFDFRRHQLSIKMDPEDANFISTATSGGVSLTGPGLSMLTQKVDALKAKEDEKKSKERALKQSLEAINERLAELGRQIKQHERNIKVADDFIKDLENGEKPELDSDGSLKNKERERLLKEYEQRTGKKVDRTNADILLQVAREQREYERQQLEIKSKKRDDLKEKLESAQEQYKEIKKVPDPAQCIEALKTLTKSLDDDTRNGLVTELNDQTAKNEARMVMGKSTEKIKEFSSGDQNGLRGQEWQVEKISLDLAMEDTFEHFIFFSCAQSRGQRPKPVLFR